MFQISTRLFAFEISNGSALVRIGSREFLLLRDYVERNRKPRLFEAFRDTEARSWEALVLRRWMVSSSPA
ncbi:hypothetical protein [Paraburkholderia sp. J94]|uniref:hypothetical protein n=1 Tax=Paraburkholderia sp. J94 TaxID=2805441 RepID=UPI002AB132DC|nr:hypothetical protein [Paraburkholderia sp. J94]